MKLVIVGGVAGGASAATRARRLSEHAEIILLERGPYVSFANCGLPYHIGEIIPQRNKLLVATVERLREFFRLDVRIQNEVISLDRSKKLVQVLDRQKNLRYTESYDKLILAPGAAPIRPNFPGSTLNGVHVLRTLEDTDAIKQAVDRGAKSSVIVGAGFIGLELAENLIHRGLHVTIVELSEQILGPFDEEMTKPIVTVLKDKGADIHLGSCAESIQQTQSGLRVQLHQGICLEASLVILGIGIKPENQLATAAGLETGIRGGIRVNTHMQTSDPDIYAAGDVVETDDFITQERIQVPLAGPANR
ncbi:MAG TPA: FAD-dependent oxidoreductase, partial [Gemmatales bacterium]|nr:FAD-dependent oxidoreductase [Gemmatales bacterium]